jgi:hypothetical protein
MPEKRGLAVKPEHIQGDNPAKDALKPADIHRGVAFQYLMGLLQPECHAGRLNRLRGRPLNKTH